MPCLWSLGRSSTERPSVYQADLTHLCSSPSTARSGENIRLRVIESEAHHVFMVTACWDPDYGTLIQELCLTRFKEDMEAIGKTLWCDWGKTIGSYGELTYCTKHVANKIGCFWPNPEVDKFFTTVHHRYFSKCPVSGRALRDPPSSILCPFIMLPITITLLVTALVVWRSKRTEGIV
ncbi:receptor activity-modifying protein 1 isoform X1 [Mesocricetus auratus]|uniref:Receptor activity-modifying protein 1 n=1 Tax=Mesocricetus auratus TaxID=10036 RepID=A0A3Q0D9I4_MESAU|nr:receptor activity-modifying protein 1 isoform X1 [Mesocricetus auratus]